MRPVTSGDRLVLISFLFDDKGLAYKMARDKISDDDTAWTQNLRPYPFKEVVHGIAPDRGGGSEEKGSRGDREKSSKKRDRQDSVKDEGDREMKKKRAELIAKKSKREEDGGRNSAYTNHLSGHDSKEL